MTKAEKDIQAGLLTVLELNTRALDKIYDVLTQIAKPRGERVDHSEQTKWVESEPVEAVPPAIESTETETPAPKKITLEYLRKAFHAIGTKITKEERKIFLAQFGGAKTIPSLDKKYYDNFISLATDIMEGE